MIGINTVYVLLLILILIIISSTKMMTKTVDIEVMLYKCSLFFDTVSEDKDVKTKCAITIQDFKELRPKANSFLVYLNNLGFSNSKLLISNNKNCLFYDSFDRLEICKDYNSNKDPDCKKCKNFWENFKIKPGILLKNNLIKKEDRNSILLYKTYNCKGSETFVIGVICQDKP